MLNSWHDIFLFSHRPFKYINNSGKKCWIGCENRCIRAISESVEEYIKRMNICLCRPLVLSISHSATSTRLSSTLFPRVECHQQIFQAAPANANVPFRANWLLIIHPADYCKMLKYNYLMMSILYLSQAISRITFVSDNFVGFTKFQNNNTRMKIRKPENATFSVR